MRTTRFWNTSSGTLKMKRLESHIIDKSLVASKPKGLDRKIAELGIEQWMNIAYLAGDGIKGLGLFHIVILEKLLKEICLISM